MDQRIFNIEYQFTDISFSTDTSLRKPIRNIHELLKSPKRSVRKRLDNLYDSSKSRENVNALTSKSRVMSGKKIAPKTPIPAPTSNPRSAKKNDLIKRNENSRQSRLLPPGTITGSYLNRRGSTASRISLFQSSNKTSLIQKSSHTKRPSDVPEESLQLVETSDDKNKPTENAKRTASNSYEQTSSNNDTQKEKETPLRCCDCSRAVICSDLSNNNSKLLDGNVNGLKNGKDIVEQKSEARIDDICQRPTVIVMQKEATMPLKKVVEDLNESPILPVHEGSYSEILTLRPSMNSTETEESLLFKYIETNCIESESGGRIDRNEEMREYICKWINTNHKTLVAQQKHLSETIAQHEKSITSLKVMLENVNSMLRMQETMRSNFNIKGSKNLSEAELSLIPQCVDGKISGSDRKGKSKSSSKKIKKPQNESNVPEATDGETKTEKSATTDPESKTDDADLAKSKKETEESKTENIENEPPGRRRSARLAAKIADQINTPLSEDKRNKASATKTTNLNVSTPSMTTPARNVKWGRRSERPLREYMVLKSAVKFLNTPDSKRYRIGPNGKVEIRDPLSRTDPEVGLADKLLMELHELYATP